jgi:hypothetical protein
MLKIWVYAAGLRVNISIRLIQTIVCLQHPICWIVNLQSFQPNKVWTTDITYIRTKQGWLYLCVMLIYLVVVSWGGKPAIE